MTSKLKISLKPLPLDRGSDEEKAAFGQLQINASDKILTEGADFSGSEITYRPGPYISGYHLAEWLAWNWWRLRWEPRPAEKNPSNHDWDFAHCMATVGEGYVWPNITISTDGYQTSLVSDRSAESASSLFQYSGPGFVGMPAADLESAIDEFVLQVVHHVNNAGLSGTNLHLLWSDLQSERSDPEVARFRRLEALLGSDPDELDADEVESHLADSSALGTRALDEIATGAGLEEMLWAQQIAAITEQVGFDINPDEGVIIDIPELRQWGELAAWRVGISVANAIREQERLGNGPITDKALANLAGTSTSVIKADRQSDGFSWVFSPSGKPARVALHSKWHTGRRFDLARLMGDNVFTKSTSGDSEPLSPATRSYSYRQKAQRAFAAELLSPWPDVKELLGNDYSEENQQQVAEYYSVSPMTIYTLIRNNTEFVSDDRMLFQY